MPLEGERPGLELVVQLENCSHLHQEHISHDPTACPICADAPHGPHLPHLPGAA